MQGALLAWFLLSRTQHFLASQPVSYSDSPSFLAKGSGAVLSMDFLFGSGRLFAVPLFWMPWLRWYGPDPAILSRVQLALACCAWPLLAVAFARHLRTALGRITATLLVLGLANSGDLAQWDLALLSESISTSLFVALVAAWLWWGHASITAERSSRAAAIAVAGLALLWGFSRESNGLFLLLLASAAVVLTMTDEPRSRRVSRSQAFAIALALGGVFLAAQVVAERGERWLFPLLNVVGRRVLPSEDRTAFYASAGMPLSPELKAMTGEFASGRDFAFYNSPALEGFRTWVRAHGRRTYSRDLLSNPIRTMTEPLADAREFLCPDLAIYRPPGFVDALPDLGLQRFCTGRTAESLLAGALAIGTLVLVLGFALRRQISLRTLFLTQLVAVLLISWPGLSWLTWHAIGEMEVGRHVLWATIFVRMALVLTAALAVDELVIRVAGARR